MEIELMQVQRKHITGSDVNNGQLVRAPMVGEPKGTPVPVCSISDAITDDIGRLERAGVRFLDVMRMAQIPSGQLFTRPFLADFGKDGAPNERVGVYVALAASHLSVERIPHRFSSWYDLYAAKTEADNLQAKVGTRN